MDEAAQRRKEGRKEGDRQTKKGEGKKEIIHNYTVKTRAHNPCLM